MITYRTISGSHENSVYHSYSAIACILHVRFYNKEKHLTFDLCCVFSNEIYIVSTNAILICTRV